MKYTRKTNYTQQQLQNALIDLMAKESFDKITINQIVDYCHLNRSTFYRYYDDKYELLQTIEERLIADFVDKRLMKVKLNQLEDQFFNEDLLTTRTQYFNKHYRQFRILLGPNCDRSFENRLRNCLNHRYQVIADGIDKKQVELVQRMIVSMIIEGLEYWLNEPSIDIETLNRVLRSILMNGPLKYLKSLKSN